MHNIESEKAKAKAEWEEYIKPENCIRRLQGTWAAEFTGTQDLRGLEHVVYYVDKHHEQTAYYPKELADAYKRCRPLVIKDLRNGVDVYQVLGRLRRPAMPHGVCVGAQPAQNSELYLNRL